MPAGCRQRGRWLIRNISYKATDSTPTKKYIKPGQNAQERKALKEKKNQTNKANPHDVLRCFMAKVNEFSESSPSIQSKTLSNYQ